jgi:hypothetical protein
MVHEDMNFNNVFFRDLESTSKTFAADSEGSTWKESFQDIQSLLQPYSMHRFFNVFLFKPLMQQGFLRGLGWLKVKTRALTMSWIGWRFFHSSYSFIRLLGSSKFIDWIFPLILSPIKSTQGCMSTLMSSQYSFSTPIQIDLARFITG